MTKGTFWLKENEDGSIRLGYEDYGVEMFGGHDYEVNYELDRKNSDRLRSYLQNNGCTGTLYEMIREEFGECLDKKPFSTTCEENSIKYGLFTFP